MIVVSKCAAASATQEVRGAPLYASVHAASSLTWQSSSLLHMLYCCMQVSFLVCLLCLLRVDSLSHARVLPAGPLPGHLRLDHLQALSQV